MKLFLKHAGNKVIVWRSIKVALIVGTILALINHFDVIFTGKLTSTIIFQVLLTYFVPYSVSTYGGACHARYIELKEQNKK
jgi:Mg/Co/Ni transporter MgtE